MNLWSSQCFQLKVFFSIFVKSWNSCLSSYFVNTHKPTWPLRRGSKLFPLHRRGLQRPKIKESLFFPPESSSRCGFMSLCWNFCENYFLLAEKSGKISRLKWFLLNFCFNSDGNSRFLLNLSGSCLQLLIWYCNQLSQKVIRLKLEKN